MAHLTERQNIASVADPDLQIIKGGGGGGTVSKKCFLALRASFWFKNSGDHGPPGPSPGSVIEVYHVNAVEASCGDGHIMLVSSRLKIKTKCGYVPILGQFVDFNSFYCPQLPTFLTQMRKIFILYDQNFRKMSQRRKISDNFQKTS